MGEIFNNKYIATNLLSKACISAIHWWVMTEFDHHQTFSKLADSGFTLNKQVEDQFYRFTKEYSLLQGTQGKRRDLAVSILIKLREVGFISFVIEENFYPIEIDNKR